MRLERTPDQQVELALTLFRVTVTEVGRGFAASWAGAEGGAGVVRAKAARTISRHASLIAAILPRQRALSSPGEPPAHRR